jgi:hypothetical protein
MTVEAEMITTYSKGVVTSPGDAAAARHDRGVDFLQAGELTSFRDDRRPLLGRNRRVARRIRPLSLPTAP